VEGKKNYCERTRRPSFGKIKTQSTDESLLPRGRASPDPKKRNGVLMWEKHESGRKKGGKEQRNLGRAHLTLFGKSRTAGGKAPGNTIVLPIKKS